MAATKDFYSNSVADAIRQACDAFSTTQEKLDIEVLETGSAGIFGLCKKRAHIRAGLKKHGRTGSPAPSTPAPPESDLHEETAAEKDSRTVVPPMDIAAEDSRPAPEKKVTGDTAAEEKKPAPEKKRAPRPPREKQEQSKAPVQEQQVITPPADEVLNKIQEDMSRMLNLMNFPSEVSVGFADGAIQCRITGPHEEDIIGPEGRTLDSLQYLIRKMMSRDLPDRMMIDLDAGDFRERRTEELRKMALELAEKVKEDGKTQAISALNPSERRVIHVALQDDKKVRSRSVGEGLFKKVLIYKPGRTKKSGQRRRGRQGGGTANE